MKLFLFSLFCITNIASADFVQGRERVIATSDLAIKTTTGEFSGAERASIEFIAEDGKGITKYYLTIGTTTYPLIVNERKNLDCGVVVIAAPAKQNPTNHYELKLTDFSQEACGARMKNNLLVDFTATKMSTGDLSKSEFFGEGTVEYKVLTQDD